MNDRVTLTLRTPCDFITATPHILRCVPENSLIVLGPDGFGVRMDAPDKLDRNRLLPALSAMERNINRSACVVIGWGCGVEQWVEFTELITELNWNVQGSLRYVGGFISVYGEEGLIEFEPSQHVLDVFETCGSMPVSGIEELENRIKPNIPPEMEDLLIEANDRHQDTPEYAQEEAQWLYDTMREGPVLLGPGEAVRLAFGTLLPEFRDTLQWLIQSQSPREWATVMADAVTQLPPFAQPGVVAHLSWAAYLSGDGPYARVALDRADEVGITRLASLLMIALAQAVPPNEFPKIERPEFL